LLIELALEADESGFDAAADLDGNGEITAVDAYYLLRFLKDPGYVLPALDPQSADCRNVNSALQPLNSPLLSLCRRS